MSRLAPVRTFALVAASGALTLPAIALSAAAQASEAPEPVTHKTRIVRYADLDLTTEAGRATLERRIAAAARTACQMEAPLTGTRIQASDAKACYDKAIRGAHAQFAQVVERRSKGG